MIECSFNYRTSYTRIGCFIHTYMGSLPDHSTNCSLRLDERCRPRFIFQQTEPSVANRTNKRPCDGLECVYSPVTVPQVAQRVSIHPVVSLFLLAFAKLNRAECALHAFVAVFPVQNICFNPHHSSPRTPDPSQSCPQTLSTTPGTP